MSRNQTDSNMIKCLDLIRYKKVVTSWNLLHNVPLNQVILQNSHSVINQDGWLGGLGRKLGKSIWKIKKVLLQSCSWSLLGVSSCRQSWSWERLSSVQPTDTNPWNIPEKHKNYYKLHFPGNSPLDCCSPSCYSGEKLKCVENIFCLTVCNNMISSSYLTENAGTFSSPINSGCLYNELNLWHLGLSHVYLSYLWKFYQNLRMCHKKAKAYVWDITKSYWVLP